MFDVKIEYKGPNGERYSSVREMFDGMRKNIEDRAFDHGIKEFEKLAAATVKDLRCPEHGTAITRISGSRSGSEIQLAIEGCCEKLIEAGKSAVAKAIKD